MVREKPLSPEDNPRLMPGPPIIRVPLPRKPPITRHWLGKRRNEFHLHQIFIEDIFEEFSYFRNSNALAEVVKKFCKIITKIENLHYLKHRSMAIWNSDSNYEAGKIFTPNNPVFTAGCTIFLRPIALKRISNHIEYGKDEP